MAGIYVHIPFCKSRCHYCNFYSVASLKHREGLIEAMKKELMIQKEWFDGEEVRTIYIGGGTPSLLLVSELEELLGIIGDHYQVCNDAEVTLEANPDDITDGYAEQLLNIGINRLSLGVQSFHDNDLEYLNRIHDGDQALASIQMAKKAGFKEISIDLIYGIPTLNENRWKENLDVFFELEINHLSAYSLTIEPKTPLEVFIRKGKMKNIDENQGIGHFEILCSEMEQHGFLHYEISNFCREGHFSKHNTAYWSGEKYLGVGPSAHSFNGHSRQWNISGIAKYMQAMDTDELLFETEELTLEQKYNEYILTSLRTMWGVDPERVKTAFGEKYHRHLLHEVKPHVKAGNILIKNGIIMLGRSGKLLADGISSSLFV